MLKIKTFAAIAIITLSSCTLQPAFAQGIEEACHDQARVMAKMHEYMKDRPDRVKLMLDGIEEERTTKTSEKDVAVREMIYYTINRLSLDTEYFKQLAFIKCRNS